MLSAIVTNINDPDKRGRVKVACQAITGDEESELPGWVEPRLSWGWFVVPDVGDEVIIVVPESADTDATPDEQRMMAASYEWHGARAWQSTTDVPAEVKVNYGKRRLFRSTSGHYMMFDDSLVGKVEIALGGPIKATITIQASGIEITSGLAVISLSPTGATTISGTIIRLDAPIVQVGVNPASSPLGAWLTALHVILSAWVPIPGDGGLALRTALTPFLALPPPGP
jgi:hypothetical protein